MTRINHKYTNNRRIWHRINMWQSSKLGKPPSSRSQSWRKWVQFANLLDDLCDLCGLPRPSQQLFWWGRDVDEPLLGTWLWFMLSSVGMQEIYGNIRLSKVDLKHFRHFQRSWNRPCQISRCTRPHNSPLTHQLFLRSDRLKLLALRAVGWGGQWWSIIQWTDSQDADDSQKRRGFAPFLTTQMMWVSQKGASFLDANYETLWNHSDPLQRKRTSVYLTLWLHDFTGRNDL